jgi:hypothetical protein
VNIITLLTSPTLTLDDTAATTSVDAANIITTTTAITDTNAPELMGMGSIVDDMAAA